jgi:hypothetical protein
VSRETKPLKRLGFSLCVIAFASTLAPSVATSSADSLAKTSECSPAAYDAMLGRADEATTRHDEHEASHIFTEAAHSRLRCAERARGDERASLIDDFAGSIENAASASVGAADYTRACRLAHEEVEVLQGQIRRHDMTSLWQRTMKLRLSGTYIYLSACKMPA